MACTSLSRSAPHVATSASRVAVIPPGAATSWPAAKAWQVSKHTPSHGRPVHRVQVGRQLLHPGRQRPSAAGARLHQQPRASHWRRPVQQRQQRPADLAQGVSACASSTALPAWNTTASRADGGARAQRVREPAAESRTVSGVGEPRLTSSVAWTNAGDPALRAAGDERAVLLRVAGDQRPAPRIADEDLHRLRAGGVHVRQRRPGQAAGGGGVRAERPQSVPGRGGHQKKGVGAVAGDGTHQTAPAEHLPGPPVGLCAGPGPGTQRVSDLEAGAGEGADRVAARWPETPAPDRRRTLADL